MMAAGTGFLLIFLIIPIVVSGSSQKTIEDEFDKKMQQLESRFTARVAALEMSEGRLRARLLELEQEVTQLKAEREDNIRSNADSADIIRRGLEKRIQSSEVAFHAYQSSATCTRDQQVVIYNTAPVNIGKGFTVSDGIFDAPVTGLYMFSWTVFAEDGYWLESELVVNGHRQGYIAADSSNTDIVPATGVVIAHVNAGEHVFVRRTAGGGCYIPRDVVRNSFTGFILLYL
ncbi:multimerin-2-like [Mya arenaria]|uniref:multimerin-2-like n=1 Tax=Mya arenaria TaxID=6604 RepID=UPI0022E33C2C|nr:multimerin-2-like [Mya arenaria]XP_052762668.1 multimerin-2-like [Mya arenaria]